MRKKTMAVLLSLVVTAGLAIGGLATAGSAQAATASKTLSVFDQNVYGAYRKGETASAKALQIVNTFTKRPDAIMLEEVCANQIGPLKSAFRKRFGVTLHVAFSQFENRCREGDHVKEGEVVASWHPLTNVQRIDLQHIRFASGRRYTVPSRGKDVGRHFSYHLTCADIGLSGVKKGALRECVTHLRHGFDGDGYYQDRYQQAFRIAEVIAAYRRYGHRVIFSGDLNSAPDLSDLNPLYRMDVHGKTVHKNGLVEMDQFDKSHFGRNAHERPTGDKHASQCRSSYQCRTGAPTGLQIPTRNDNGHIVTPKATVKLDYTFFTPTAASRISGYTRRMWTPRNWHDPNRSPGSDHLALISSVTYRLPRP